MAVIIFIELGMAVIIFIELLNRHQMTVSDRQQKYHEPAGCQRCGACCRHGGPALHPEDRNLFDQHVLSVLDLIAVRVGEPAHNPLQERIEPTPHEFLKIKGSHASWSCGFFNQDEGQCLIYQTRPLECRLLFCRDTGPLEEVMGRDLLTRKDLLVEDDPVLSIIDRQEPEIAFSEVNDLLIAYKNNENREQLIDKLTSLVRQDLLLRSEFLQNFPERQGEEMFLLGRPLFLVLAPYGLRIIETASGISLEGAEPFS